MGLKRTKSNKKAVNLYRLAFNFRRPYQIITDHEFCRTCVTSKFDIRDKLKKIFQDEVKMMTCLASWYHNMATSFANIEDDCVASVVDNHDALYSSVAICH